MLLITQNMDIDLLLEKKKSMLGSSLREKSGEKSHVNYFSLLMQIKYSFEVM